MEHIFATTVGESMKTFPILAYYRWPNCPSSIPYGMVKQYEEQIIQNWYNQTIDEIVKRGGLSPLELISIIKNQKFPKLIDRPTTAETVKELLQLIENYNQNKPQL